VFFVCADVKRLDHSRPFAFTQPTRKVNWKRLRQLDVDALVRHVPETGPAEMHLAGLLFEFAAPNAAGAVLQTTPTSLF
jgi:hypothetical protein